MKRHKPKAHDWPRPCLCEGCPSRGVQFNGVRFVYRCKVDGALIETPPAYCPYKTKEDEDHV